MNGDQAIYHRFSWIPEEVLPYISSEGAIQFCNKTVINLILVSIHRSHYLRALNTSLAH